MNVFMIDLSTGATLELPSTQQTYQTKVDTDTGKIELVVLPASDMKAQYGSCWICPMEAMIETRESYQNWMLDQITENRHSLGIA
jgi:hypothetical protein